MKRPGHVALVPFPFTDLRGAKLRPILLLRKASHRHDDWLVCMISSRLDQAEPELDELLLPEHDDFPASGLKVPSVLRVSRLAVVAGDLLSGSIGTLSDSRLHAVRHRLCNWIIDNDAP